MAGSSRRRISQYPSPVATRTRQCNCDISLGLPNRKKKKAVGYRTDRSPTMCCARHVCRPFSLFHAVYVPRLSASPPSSIITRPYPAPTQKQVKETRSTFRLQHRHSSPPSHRSPAPSLPTALSSPWPIPAPPVCPTVCPPMPPSLMPWPYRMFSAVRSPRSRCCWSCPSSAGCACLLWPSWPVDLDGDEARPEDWLVYLCGEC